MHKNALKYMHADTAAEWMLHKRFPIWIHMHRHGYTHVFVNSQLHAQIDIHRHIQKYMYMFGYEYLELDVYMYSRTHLRTTPAFGGCTHLRKQKAYTLEQCMHLHLHLNIHRSIQIRARAHTHSRTHSLIRICIRHTYIRATPQS